MSLNRRQKTWLIHRQLEGNKLRPRHPQYCFRLQKTSVYHTSYKSQPSKCRPHRFRGGELSHQGGHCRNPPNKRRFLQSLVPSPQKGWNLLTCVRLEFPEQFRGKLSLPDGKHSLLKVSTSKRQLYDHSGSERRLFVRSSPQGLSEVPSTSLRTKLMLLLPVNQCPRRFSSRPPVPRCSRGD